MRDGASRERPVVKKPKLELITSTSGAIQDLIVHMLDWRFSFPQTTSNSDSYWP